MKPSATYQPPRSLREEPAVPPTEIEIQALWFEQLYRATLATDDGRTVEVIQPGFWNHTGGPDFIRAALRFSGPGGVEETRVGSVEVHLRAEDWHAHGHDADPAYDETILHVVWDSKSRKAFFPATSAFRRVPQVIFGSQLVAPWEELQPLCTSLLQRPLPDTAPGRCSATLAQLPAERVLEIVRTAGLYRVRQKAQRWYWRRRITSPEQALFEALAEALGFHANQIPMRLVAQRLPWKFLRAMEPQARLAHLFGLAGYLPDENLARLRAEPRKWLRELWEIWWKARSALDYALLSKSQWKLAGLRPLNRPERRLAALAQIVPLIPALTATLAARNSTLFGETLLGIRDPFWEKHATLSGQELRNPCRLVGEERVHDILINVFWPIVSLDDPSESERGLIEMNASPNSAARIASQRMLVVNLSARQMKEALVQQGLLQIFRDYCLADCSQCRACTFPELIGTWETPLP
jgi:hypothetical protein